MTITIVLVTAGAVIASATASDRKDPSAIEITSARVKSAAIENVFLRQAAEGLNMSAPKIDIVVIMRTARIITVTITNAARTTIVAKDITVKTITVLRMTIPNVPRIGIVILGIAIKATALTPVARIATATVIGAIIANADPSRHWANIAVDPMNANRVIATTVFYFGGALTRVFPIIMKEWRILHGP